MSEDPVDPRATKGIEQEAALALTAAEPAPVASDSSPAARFGLVAFVRAAGLLSVSAIANLLRAIITAKLLAVTLGPSTTGVLVQILNFSALLFQIIPLGLTIGVSKLVADNPTSRSRVGAVIGTSSVIAFASAMTCIIVLAPFSNQISLLLTGTDRYGLPVLLVLLSLPLYNVAGVLSYVIQGLAEIRRLTIANVVTAVTSLAALIPLTYAYGLTGAVVAIVIASGLQITFFAAETWRACAARGWSWSALQLSRTTAVSLLRYGGVMMAAGIGSWGSLLVVRTVGIHVLGDFANGIYQVVNGVSAQYMAVFTGWMAAYVFPRVVAERDHGRLAVTLNSVLRANLLIMGSGLALTVALRELVVQVLYTPAFATAAPMLPIQALGDYARIIGWTFGIALFAHDRIRAYLIAMLAQNFLWLLITIPTLKLAGVAAFAMGYSLSSLAWPIVMYSLVRKWFGVRIDREGAILCVVGLVGILGPLVLPNGVSLLPVLAVPIAILIMRQLAQRQAGGRALR